MENADEVFNFLEDFSKRKNKTIPQELNEYLAYVARTGDPVYQWCFVKCLFKEKLMTVITDFYETTPGIEIPPYPNVDAFNYDIMKNSLLERLDSFTSAPFTVQRICELLTFPRKQYNRVDKFMRAIEKNILVVSTREPGVQRQPEPDNSEPMESVVNGSDNNSEYNVDVEMEDMSWKENSESRNNLEPQPSSSDTHISVDDLASRLHKKQDVQDEIQAKPSTEASVNQREESNSSDNLPKDNVSNVSNNITQNTEILTDLSTKASTSEESKTSVCTTDLSPETNVDTEMNLVQTSSKEDSVPEIKVEDTEMTEQKNDDENLKLEKKTEEIKSINEEIKIEQQELNTQLGNSLSSDESSSDSNSKEEIETKMMSEVITSSEDNSSSSDNTEGNSNSPKTEEIVSNDENVSNDEVLKSDIDLSENSSEVIAEKTETADTTISPNKTMIAQIQTDNYSISDVNSELPLVPEESDKTSESETISAEEPIQETEGKEDSNPEPTCAKVDDSESSES